MSWRLSKKDYLLIYAIKFKFDAKIFHLAYREDIVWKRGMLQNARFKIFIHAKFLLDMYGIEVLIYIVYVYSILHRYDCT